MRCELEEKLYAIEPGWFDRERGAMAFGFEHDDGWYQLVENLLNLAKERRAAWTGDANKNPFAPGRFSVRQVKQKMAGLRFYYVGGDEEFERAVREAEKASLLMCEVCGEAGKVDRNNRGAYKTLCEKHKFGSLYARP